jgi:hypothetical protein
VPGDDDRRIGVERDCFALVEDLDRLACDQLVSGVAGRDLDSQPSVSIEQSEGEAAHRGREGRPERERVAVIAQTAEPCDGDEPRARECR